MNPEERKVIEQRAAAARLSLSAFLRAACLGANVGPAAGDLKAVALLAKVHADQGRLGGLLKMYLQDRNPDRQTAERLLGSIEEVRAELVAAAKRILPE